MIQVDFELASSAERYLNFDSCDQVLIIFVTDKILALDIKPPRGSSFITSREMLLKLALAFVFACAASAQLLPPSGFRIRRPGPVVQTNNGPIQGMTETYDLFRRMNTFKGVRYGQPPVGNNRFRQALPALASNQLHQAFDYGASCPQFSILLNRFQGEEDCLFLNIAAPTTIRSRLPVVVAVHGGGLQFGNGEMSLLGPEYIVQDNIIFVSMNYRLNVLGFFSTNDGNSPGNYGLKDIVLALQWVRSNIEFFGGDPNDVTIMGISGGAVAVHALVVSPAATGLFHKALSQSGSLFNNWAFTRNPIPQVNRLIQRLQIQVSGNVDLMNQLRQVSLERLLEAAGPFVNDAPSLIDELPFMPLIDPLDSTEMIIFPAPIEQMIQMGPINTVPYMVGFNAQESLNSVMDPFNNPTIFERFNQNPHLLVPNEWNLQAGTANSQMVIQTFRNLYFGGATTLLPTPEHAWGWSQYISDRSFIFGISKQARMHAARQPVFYFQFSYTGALSFAQRLFGLGELPGAMHGDDAFYLFRLNVAVTPVLPSDPAYQVSRSYIRMWTNFIKTGHPTPINFDPLVPTQWPQMDGSEQFMDIGENLTVQVHPNRARADIWHTFDNQFRNQ